MSFVKLGLVASTIIGVALLATHLSAAAPPGRGRPDRQTVVPVKKPDPKRKERDPIAASHVVDELLDAKLREVKIPSSPEADDAEFLRRVTLDVIGRIPTLDEAEKFLADKSTDKRQALIDSLLAKSEYGKQFGSLWYHLLVEPNDDNRQLISATFETWLAEQFNQNRGWDRIVSDILLASGDRDKNPATVFWLSHVEGAQQRELKPAQIAGAATQRFLGTQYQCAECHNHPFTGYKQTDFWGIAAFFGKTEVDHANKKEAKQGAIPSVLERPAGQTAIIIPDTKGKVVYAKLPDGRTPSKNAKGPALRQLFADWVVSPKNKAFSRAAVNRMWAHFFGKGFVNPVDDFREGNDPVNPEVLDRLAEEFRESGFDLKHLVRCICNTKAYQRTSDPLTGNEKDAILASHMAIKQMGPEVLLASLSTATGENLIRETGRERKKEGKKGQNNPKKQFLALFNTGEERDFSPDYTHGIPQALQLMNGKLAKEEAAIVRQASRRGVEPERVIEKLYLAALSRKPTPKEMEKMKAYVASQDGGGKAYNGVLWVLLNSSEFVLNH